jgi:sigma-B regulation protein RsbU (phosphoserine phosphatase)
MGLSPVVLFAILMSVTAYLFAGQFATNTALTLLEQRTAELRDETGALALLSLTNQPHDTAAPHSAAPATDGAPLSLAVLRGDVLQPLAAHAVSATHPFAGKPLPTWLNSGFHGIVSFDGNLYMAALINLPNAGHTVTVLGTRPLNKATLDETAKGLGRVTLMSGFSLANHNRDNQLVKVNVSDDDDSNIRGVHVAVKPPPAPAHPAKSAPKSVPSSVPKSVPSSVAQSTDTGAPAPPSEDDDDFDRLTGGVLAPAAHLIDPPVVFTAPLTAHAWSDGHEISGLVMVVSRPSVLYAHLFATSAGIGSFVRVVLISIAIFFAVLELLALLMAAGLSRTITRSIAELYQGTREIDLGHFDHRIRIKRKDQLGALATSFNAMTASIVDLLAQQREKERLLSELAIAQEVQTNLFPHSPVELPGFEIHAVCIPARSVSGDYYDFIFGRLGSDLCLALGDISGKGISAALLMASLHSAVRAFGISTGKSGAPGDGPATSEGPGRPSPALLLELLNRHIYSSTPPEKYATLFLAYYDGLTRRLTYSNGGHLPPLVLSTDGTVRRLDCGGSVIGLLPGMHYEEATVELAPGDLLMAFSDGLTEPERDNQEFGEQRLLDYIQQHRNQPLPILATSTLQTLQQWIGNNEQPDDMTLLLARQL